MQRLSVIPATLKSPHTSRGRDLIVAVEALPAVLADESAIHESHDGKGANGSKNRPHDAYPVRCRVPGYYEPCSERACVCQLKPCRQLRKSPHIFSGQDLIVAVEALPAVLALRQQLVMRLRIRLWGSKYYESGYGAPNKAPNQIMGLQMKLQIRFTGLRMFRIRSWGSKYLVIPRIRVVCDQNCIKNGLKVNFRRAN